MLNPELIREFFNYDPVTGILTWRIRRANNIKEGDVCGYLKSDGYLVVGVAYKLRLVHRIAWAHFHGTNPPKYLYHINGDRSDNRIGNLRAATRSLNAQNVRKPYRNNKGSGLLGVYPHACGKWQARIQIDGKPRSLGLFTDKHKASDAYLAAKRSLHPFCTI